MNKSRVASPEEFWNAVERIYGEVPNIIKLILQVNGFNSFLALKGIRYEDKQDFFQSLELTILELLNSDYDSQEKKEVEAELAAQYYNVNSFRLKPGHRNYIMNLMLEIENIDINEFFGRALNDSRPPDSPTKSSSLVNQEYLAQLPSSDQIVIVKPRTSRSEEDKQIIVNKVDHGYSRDDQEQESEFIFEEEYLTDDTMDSISQFKVEYEPVSITRQSNKRRATTQASPSSAVKRRPDHMYNEDFIAKCVNPRRRRVTLNKTYPTTDEGTRERFTDLIQQSMQCILPREKLPEVENVEVHVEKESDTSWAVYCPLCHSRIRLPVVYENGGRYCNYKRSNFERHLRFKHCKGKDKREIYETVEMVEEIVD